MKYQPPPRTGMEVFMMLPEGTLAELINDVIYITSPRNFQHQQALGNIAALIWPHVKKNNFGNCLALPLDVFLDKRNVVHPDLMVLLGNIKQKLTKEQKIKAVPDLIIEVMSTGNKTHDTKTKKALYEKFGVKEYFIIDPDNKEMTTYYLTNSKFAKQSSVKGKIKSKLLKKVFVF